MQSISVLVFVIFEYLQGTNKLNLDKNNNLQKS